MKLEICHFLSFLNVRKKRRDKSLRRRGLVKLPLTDQAQNSRWNDTDLQVCQCAGFCCVVGYALKVKIMFSKPSPKTVILWQHQNISRNRYKLTNWCGIHVPIFYFAEWQRKSFKTLEICLQTEYTAEKSVIKANAQKNECFYVSAWKFLQ